MQTMATLQIEQIYSPKAKNIHLVLNNLYLCVIFYGSVFPLTIQFLEF